jgi:hypothetical protein
MPRLKLLLPGLQACRVGVRVHIGRTHAATAAALQQQLGAQAQLLLQLLVWLLLVRLHLAAAEPPCRQLQAVWCLQDCFKAAAVWGGAGRRSAWRAG